MKVIHEGVFSIGIKGGRGEFSDTDAHHVRPVQAPSAPGYNESHRTGESIPGTEDFMVAEQGARE